MGCSDYPHGVGTPHPCSRRAAPCRLLFMLTRALLMPSFHITVPIGVAVSALHFYAAMESQHLDWWQVFLAAYTVGAWCKMGQFAFGHDICHNTAGWLCDVHPFMKHLWLHVLTLPAIGGETVS